MAQTLRVSVSEDLYAALSLRADQLQRPLDVVASAWVQDQARLMRDIPVGTPALVIGGGILEQLAGILGGGSILHAPDLLEKVERLAGISFHHLRLPFTPGQLEMLAEKAARQGLSVEELIRRTAPRVHEQFFDLLARA